MVDSGRSLRAEPVMNQAQGLGHSVTVSNAERGLRKVACQMRHRLSDMELRSNVSWPASSPAAKTSGYVISEVADWQLRQWLSIVENAAKAIEARQGGGEDAVHESAVRQDLPEVQS